MYFNFQKSSSLGYPIIIASYCEKIDDNDKGFWIRHEAFVDEKKAFEHMLGEELEPGGKVFPTYYGDAILIDGKQYPYDERFEVTGKESAAIMGFLRDWRPFDLESWGK